MTATAESRKTYELPVPDLSDGGLAEVTARSPGTPRTTTAPARSRGGALRLSTGPA